MLPILFSIGPFTLYSLWVFVIAGMLLGTLLFLKRIKYNRMDLSLLLDNGLSLLFATAVISRLAFFLTNWGYFGMFSWGTFLKQLVYFWQSGYSFWGAVLGFGAMLWVHALRKGENAFNWIDAFLSPLFVGMILGHIGQLLDGQGYGRETIMPWGIAFETTNVKYTVPIHPTQIYGILLILVILLIRKRVVEKWPVLGQKHLTALAMLTAYSLGRFVIEFFRGDDTLQMGFVRIGHIGWLVALGVSGWILWRKLKKPSTTGESS